MRGYQSKLAKFAGEMKGENKTVVKILSEEARETLLHAAGAQGFSRKV